MFKHDSRHSLIYYLAYTRFQMIAMALKRKQKLLTAQMVDILYTLVGRDPAYPEYVAQPYLTTDGKFGCKSHGNCRDAVLANITAFKHLLLDWDVWQGAEIAVCVWIGLSTFFFWFNVAFLSLCKLRYIY